MKVRLVVASGVHQGKEIAIPGTQFLIGRDPSCQLRPASQMVSKQHCAIVIKDSKVYIKDFGSTNGTFVNDEQLAANAAVEAVPGTRVKVGPLDFSIEFTLPKVSDSTPMPDQLQAVTPVTTKLAEAAGAAAGTGSDVSPGKKSSSSLKPAPKQDDIAAMLLDMDSDSAPAEVPDGSTIMEMPAVLQEAIKAAEEKKKGAIPTREDSSNAASEILKRMMRRPR
jgi:predicted component of type VI protein secretion system